MLSTYYVKFSKYTNIKFNSHIIRKGIIIMPNHIKNVWKFKNLTQENIQFILNNITKKLDRNGNEILNNSDIVEKSLKQIVLHIIFVL